MVARAGLPLRRGFMKLRNPQITQYPAATPKAKAATMVSRSRMEEDKIVIIRQSIFSDAPPIAADVSSESLKSSAFLAASANCDALLYLALTPGGVDN